MQIAMAKKVLHNPHDRLIKLTFRRRSTAASFLQAYLPSDLVSGVNWKSLVVRPGSFLDSRFKAHESDLLFEVRFRGEPLLLYCLFEHQSTNDPWMGLRLLGYLHAIWQEVAKDSVQRVALPAMIPVVLYQSLESWTAPLRWREYIALPEAVPVSLEGLSLDFGYQLIDLSRLSVDEIRGDLFSQLTLGLMKALMDGRTLSWIESAGPLLRELVHRKNVTGMLEALLRYLLSEETRVNYKDMVAALQSSTAPEIATRAKSIAERLFEDGHERGRLEGQIQMLEKMLKQHVTPSSILEKKTPKEMQGMVDELSEQFAKIARIDV